VGAVVLAHDDEHVVKEGTAADEGRAGALTVPAMRVAPDSDKQLTARASRNGRRERKTDERLPKRGRASRRVSSWPAPPRLAADRIRVIARVDRRVKQAWLNGCWLLGELLVRGG